MEEFLKAANRAMIIESNETGWLRLRKQPLPASHILKPINTACLNEPVLLSKIVQFRYELGFVNGLLKPRVSVGIDLMKLGSIEALVK